MRFIDALAIDGAMRRTADGYAVLSARAARGGNVQIYRGAELGLMDRDTVRVYRPAEEVFRKDAIASYAGVPVTLNHPPEQVTAETWKDVAVGEVGEDVLRDGEFVRVPMMLRDAKAIAAVEGGTRELSMGYEAHVDLKDGVSPLGETYDAEMTGFRMNHIAIVPVARGGSDLRIGDGASARWGASPIITDRKAPDMADAIKTRTVLIDGLSVETTDAGAQALEKLQGQIKAQDAQITTTKTAHDAAIAAKDEEIGKLKADLAKAQDAAKIDVDALVAARAALVSTVKAIDAKIDPAGKSDADLRKAAVASKLGDAMVADASEAEVAGMFKAIAKDAGSDPVRDTLKDGVTPPVTDAARAADAAWSKGVADLNAWRKEA